MERIPSVLMILAAGALSVAHGQSPSPNPPDASIAPAASENRPVSSDVASMLSAGLPKYNPPKPAPPPKPEAEQVDLREIDRPKNGIIRLPKMVVHADKPPVFRDRDIYTEGGLERLAYSRYRGLGLVPFGKMNAKIAQQMQRDDERLQNMAEFKDTADAIGRGGDAAESEYIKRASQSTYQRSLDWGAPAPQNPSAMGVGERP